MTRLETNPPDPSDPQALPQDVDTILAEVFGFERLHTGQAEAIDAVLSGRNVFAVMPTGAGKSLCYQLPALAFGGLTIVVSPLVALMRDQVAALRLNGVAAATINSDRSREENVATWRDVQAGAVRLLYLSPERLMTEPMLAALARLDVRLIAVDEAHCISQWGPAFRPEYAALARLSDRFPDTPLVALTATADPATRTDISEKIFSGDVLTVVTGFDRPNLNLGVTLKDGWKRQVLDFVAERRSVSGIVYCLSRRKTEEIAALLREHGHSAFAFHAGMENEEKARVQNRFMTEPATIIVATVAFGMGIDKPDIRFVLHTDLPASPEAYYQEIGRAGRDGAPAETMLLYGLDDVRMRRVFIEQEDSAPERKRREHKRLDALLTYCEAPTCRRRMLLRYFGEDIAPCGNCDICLNPVETVDGTLDAKKALSAVYRTGQRFGTAHIIDILRGNATEKVTQLGHDSLPTFGVGAERSKREWQGTLRQMVAAGLLDLDVTGFGGLRATDTGLAVMRGAGDPFHYRPDTIRKSGAKQRRSSAKGIELESLDEDGNRLLQSLKALRLELATARGVPAYVIFSDRSLIDMAAKQPKDLTEFGDIFGVGQAKIRDFGTLFLEAVANHAGAENKDTPASDGRHNQP